MQNNYAIIGIDGGATKVSAWHIKYNRDNNTFSLAQANSTRSYRDFPGFIHDFKPVDIKVQLAQREKEIQPTIEEQQQAEVYVQACASAIKDIVEQTGISTVLAGIGMPGLKTEDKRGISVVANGPRMIHYAHLLETILDTNNIKLLSRIDHLGSDADYCGIGENYSAEGLFRNADHGYYLGGGTGVADAMKLDGQLVKFDDAKDWIAKTWEMKNNDDISLEKLTSVNGIQNIYASFSGKSIEYLNEHHIYPLQIAALAEKGDEAAKNTFKLVVNNLAALLYERITTLQTGWQHIFQFVNPNKPELKKNHPHLHKVFDTIIIGQRLGELFESKSGVAILQEPVLKLLDEKIQNSSILPGSVKSHYRNIPEIVKVSKLREGPALGAGIDAYLTYSENG